MLLLLLLPPPGSHSISAPSPSTLDVISHSHMRLLAFIILCSMLHECLCISLTTPQKLDQSLFIPCIPCSRSITVRIDSVTLWQQTILISQRLKIKKSFISYSCYVSISSQQGLCSMASSLWDSGGPSIWN